MDDGRSLQARLMARALTALAAVAVVVLLVLSGLPGRMDQSLFDLLSRTSAVQRDPRIVVVAIDRASLAELGNWPWSRRTHARMVERLDQTGVQAIALDLLLTQPALYDPEGDALLARALSRSGKVVVPVHAEPGAGSGSGVELMPVPEFAATAAAMGHLDRFADADGKYRSLYLRAGLGSPHWPAMALALQQVAGPQSPATEQPGQRFPAAYAPALDYWVRDYRVLLPHRKPDPGYLRLSYMDVLEGRVDPAALRDRYAWVGMTVPAPGSAAADAPGQDPKPALEYQLQALDTLLNGDAIVPLGTLATMALSALLACLPLLLGLCGLRSLGKGLGLAVVATVLLSWSLLQWGQAWFAPGAALLTLGLGALAWMAWRWRRGAGSDGRDPLTGLANRTVFDQRLHHELRLATRSGQPLSLLLLEIDPLQGQSGHEGTAPPLVEALADSLRLRARRPRDLVARLEQDHFAVLLPETTPHAAAAIATTLHVDLANRGVQRDPSSALVSTLSIGLDTYQPGEASLAMDLFARADAARMHARLSGGNRTVSHAELAALMASLNAGH